MVTANPRRGEALEHQEEHEYYPLRSVRVALGVAQRLQWHPGGCQHTFLEVAVALTCHRTSADLMAWWMLGQISANRPPDHSRTRSDASNVDILTTGTDKDIFDSCELNGLLEAMSSYTTRRELRIARAHDR